MKESNLWGHLKVPLSRYGKFQKISDRFTPGIPDVLGVALKPHRGKGCAFELKELKLVDGCLVAKFRPGQLAFLRDWERAGGLARTIASYRNEIYALDATHSVMLETGLRSIHGYARVRELNLNYERFIDNLLRERT